MKAAEKQTIGLTLRELREVKELSLRKAAILARMDQSALSRIENGHRRPTHDQLSVLASLYGASLGDLEARLAFSEITSKYAGKPSFGKCLALLNERAEKYGRSGGDCE